MLKKYSYILKNLDCAICADKIEAEIKRNKNFKNVRVNFNTMKLTFETEKHKIVGMFWSQGERFGKDIKLGQYYDILYNMSKNYYNGFITNKIIIKDLQISDL